MCYITKVIRKEEKMPPVRKITKEDIIKASLEILKEESIENLNARTLASYLKCSVQPIFYNFKNMEELKNVVYEKIYTLYQSYMKEGASEKNSYQGMGLAYIKFAKDYPNYFKLIFSNKTDLTPETFIINDSIENHVIEEGMKLTGFTYEEQRKFHLKVWIFTHGLATLVAANTIRFSDQEIKKILKESVREMLIGRNSEKK